jgi:hypothetical protein
MSPKGQDVRAAEKETSGLMCPMRAAIDQGHHVLCKLRAIKEVLAELEERAAALRRCLPSSDLCE